MAAESADASVESALTFLRDRARAGAGVPDDIPKHARVRRLLVEAVDTGALRHGDRLPAELDIAALLGVSLGTVRRALSQMVSEAIVVRVQGRGTFVADVPRPFFRFADGRGNELPVRSRQLARRRIERRGPWSDALGGDGGGWIRIRRSFDVAARFTVASDFYVDAGRFPGMLEVSLGEDARLKRILGERYRAPVIRVRQFAAVRPVNASIATLLEVEVGTHCLVVEATSYGLRGDAVCFQLNWIPPGAERLELASPDRSPGGPIE